MHLHRQLNGIRKKSKFGQLTGSSVSISVPRCIATSAILFLAVSVTLGSACTQSPTEARDAPHTDDQHAAAPSGDQPSNESSRPTAASIKTAAAAITKRLESELTELSELIEKGKTDADLYYKRGLAKHRLRSFVPVERKLALDEEAIADFERADELSQPDGHARALVAAGRVHLRRYENVLAFPFFHRAREISPSDVHVRAESIRMEAWSTGDWGTACAAFEKLVLEPSASMEPSIWHALGYAYGMIGKPVDAEKAYRKVLALDPDKLMIWINIGYAMGEQGKEDEAIEVLNLVRALDKTNVYATNNLAARLNRADRPNGPLQAKQMLTELLEIAPQFPAAWLNLGNSNHTLGNYEEAIAAYRHAIDLFPGYADAYSNMGSTLRKTGRYEEAITALGTALTYAPNHTDALSTLGKAYDSAGRTEDAVSTFRRLVEVSPRDSKAWNSLGVILSNMPEQERRRHSQSHPYKGLTTESDSKVRGNTDVKHDAVLIEALNCFRRALKLDPKNFLAFENLANTLSKVDDAAEVIKLVDPFLKRNPKSSRMYRIRGLANFHLGNLTVALSDFELAVSYGAGGSQDYLNWGIVQIGANDLKSAVKTLRHALSLDQSKSYALLYLWTAHIRAGEVDKAATVVDSTRIPKVKDAWMRALLRLTTGEESTESLLKKADTVEKRCEAYFYLAEQASVDNHSKARQLREACLETRIYDFWEYRLAALAMKGSTKRVEP